ncbi:alkaline shock response membrane anchor protein AmaP [Streptomyces botrytidirepellens]|uniref:Alkaline shock response membrane anchor protein AmaP n=1 Tax=Streptomyces botrytidirepellens TaxID=2486417 RepID=A0A3M8VJC0_9ACTN|nr:alkaline shock response membrane anchor protein AmaP [Streptomyces botrytidirepellens]RNG17730.1 alkaline shock response membrane anchor protein AmaP [Streptomyces botrytidirepellens]
MRHLTKTNRVLLALLGLVLLGGGLLVLASGADLYRRWNLTPPAGWPLTAPHDVLIPRADQARWGDQGWWWVAATAALALLLLLALTWLLSQPRRRPRQLSVGDTPGDDVRVNGHALGQALTTELDVLPGVRRSRARFFGPSTRPRVRIDLTLEPGGTPEHVLTDLRDAVDRARSSAGWDQLPKEVRLGVARHGPHRAE